ncbi:MAG: hypothetical protein H7Y31_01235 [Chitinophagaceae bacterium]|nr:hypothetical protein [Chitinophagaceae bacterium]
MRSLTAFLAIILFVSCNFSKGVKKDLTTGLSTSYNGFSVDDIYLTDGAGNKLGSNKIKLGSKVELFATGVGNYGVKDGKVYPGCQILLTDKKTGAEILNLPDAFADLKDGKNKTEASVLKAYLTTGDPMQVGSTYHLKTRFFDKNKVENQIVSDVDLLVEN